MCHILLIFVGCTQSLWNAGAVQRALVPAIISVISLLNHLSVMASKYKTVHFSPITALFDSFPSLNHTLGDTITFWSISVTKNQRMSKWQSHGLSGTQDP